MSELEKMKEDFNVKVQLLQASCVHEKLSDWTIEYWAIAHSTGFTVKYCMRCGKTVHRKTSCFACRKEIVDDQVKDGDGIHHPFGGRYCKKCSEETDPWMKKMEKLMAKGAKFIEIKV